MSACVFAYIHNSLIYLLQKIVGLKGIHIFSLLELMMSLENFQTHFYKTYTWLLKGSNDVFHKHFFKTYSYWNLEKKNNYVYHKHIFTCIEYKIKKIHTKPATKTKKKQAFKILYFTFCLSIYLLVYLFIHLFTVSFIHIFFRGSKIFTFSNFMLWNWS